MKKTKIIGIVCIMLVVLCCFAACDSSYNANGANTVDITVTLTHPDGVVLQKIESTFTKEGRTYNYTTTKTIAFNSFDGENLDMYSTEKTSGSDAQLTVPSWVAEDFAEIYENSETKLHGKATAEKIAALGITNAASDVVVELQLDNKHIVSMSVSYSNAKGETVSIVATMTY